MEFKDRLKELRLNFSPSLTQDELATKLGMSRSTIGMYESGRRTPGWEDMESIADFFNVDISYLRGKSDKKTTVLNYPAHLYAYYSSSCAAGLPVVPDAVQGVPLLSVPDVILGKHAGDKSLLFIHANGESMNKVFPDGSLLAVLPVELLDLRNGEIVVFEDETHSIAVKRYFRQGSTIIFKPDSTNEDYYDLIYKAEENKIRIIGKVVTYVVTL